MAKEYIVVTGDIADLQAVVERLSQQIACIYAALWGGKEWAPEVVSSDPLGNVETAEQAANAARANLDEFLKSPSPSLRESNLLYAKADMAAAVAAKMAQTESPQTCKPPQQGHDGGSYGNETWRRWPKTFKQRTVKTGGFGSPGRFQALSEEECPREIVSAHRSTRANGECSKPRVSIKTLDGPPSRAKSAMERKTRGKQITDLPLFTPCDKVSVSGPGVVFATPCEKSSVPASMCDKDTSGRQAESATEVEQACPDGHRMKTPAIANKEFKPPRPIIWSGPRRRSRPASPRPIEMSSLMILHRFTRWLQDSIYLQFQTGNLFVDDGEALVHSCKASSSSANTAENAGDHFMCTGSGRTRVRKILSMLPEASRVPSEDLQEAAQCVAEYFVANVGFGPYAAEALGLRELYSFTPGLQLDREVLAGLFEQTLYVLQREGMDALLDHILMWCVGCLLHMINNRAGGSPGTTVLEQVNGDAYRLAVSGRPIARNIARGGREEHQSALEG